jgi:hypothetical protein
MAESNPFREGRGDDWDPNLNRVPDRLRALREKCSISEGWGIVSELLNYQPGDGGNSWCIFKVTVVHPDGRPVGVGHARARVGDGRFHEKSLLEVCETKALGRALAACGLHGKEYASEFEIETVKPPKSDAETNSAPAIGARKEPEPPATESAPKKAPAKSTKKGAKRKAAKKAADKPKAPPAEAPDVNADTLVAAILESTTPEELTAAFNNARLNAAEFDDWTEVSALATEQFKAINASYVKGGQAPPANDGEWCEFIAAMRADKAAMRNAERPAPERRPSIAEQYTRRVDPSAGVPLLGDIS